jgi:hypothetical protein
MSLIQSLKQQILNLVTSTDFAFQTFHIRQLKDSDVYATKHTYRNTSKLEDISLTGGITICALREEDEVALSVSVCSAQDNFSKVVGNRISLVRLLKFYNTPTADGVVIPPLTCVFKIAENEDLYEQALVHAQLLVSTQLRPIAII